MQVGDKFALYSRHEGFIRIVTIDKIVDEGDSPLDRYAHTKCGVRLHTEKQDDRYYTLLDKNVWAMPATPEDALEQECLDLLEYFDVQPKFDDDSVAIYAEYRDRLIAAKETIEAFKKSWEDGFVF